MSWGNGQDSRICPEQKKKEKKTKKERSMETWVDEEEEG